MSRFLNDRYNSFEAYTPGEQCIDKNYIKLNTNESPFPPSDAVIEAVNEAEIKSLNLYPDPECKKLRKKIADLYGVSAENILLANGSDDILNFAFMAFGSDDIVFPDVTYGFYTVFADLHGLKYTQIPLNDDFSIDCEKYFRQKGMVIIANPNAPTGLALNVSQIESIVRENPDNVVLIDEAYVDFGAQSCYKLIDKYDNLLVVQTYSKSRSMAGARLGYSIASKGLIDDLEKIRYSTNPYNINRLTMIAGEAAIDSDEYFRDKCKVIIENRKYATDGLEKLDFYVVSSSANFVFAKHRTISGETIYKELKENGILVRHFSDKKISDFNRISIGTKEQMDILLNTLKKIIG